MILKKTKIKDLFIFNFEVNSDNRGSFQRLFCEKKLKKILKSRKIVQVSYSQSKGKNLFRGLHYQKSPYSEMKIIRCLKGKILDLALDLRTNSKSFLHYHSEILSEQNKKAILIPEGFAHGFQLLSKNCEMIYFTTAKYNKKYEAGINVSDPLINIHLPYKISKISKRDKEFKYIHQHFKGIKVEL